MDRGVDPLDAVLNGEDVVALFQPIVHVRTQEIVGFEALSRVAVGGCPTPVPALLAQAAAAGRLVEVDRALRTAALAAIRHHRLPAEIVWMVNIEPAGLIAARSCAATTCGSAADARVVLEVVERGLASDLLGLLRAAGAARPGIHALALDDVGAAPESMALLWLLRPDVVKVDIAVLGRLPIQDAGVVISAVCAYTDQSGAVIVAEGVEDSDGERLAEQIGATYVQGFRYGRAAPLPAWLPVPHHPIGPSVAAPLARSGSLIDALAGPDGAVVASADEVALLTRLLARDWEPASGRRNPTSITLVATHDQITVTAAGSSSRLPYGRHARPVPFGEEVIVLATPRSAIAVVQRGLESGEVQYLVVDDAEAVAAIAGSLADRVTL